MLSFAVFLNESLDVQKLKHLEHAEDHIIHGGHEGVKHAASTLEDVYNFLQGKKTGTRITTKFDGAPSIVFGINPDNGKFFVATKSAFNKTPKLNYTKEDIERNHGHAPGLVEKLSYALDHLKKIMPKEGGVYQGDIMYTKPDVAEDDKELKFTPNTITYSADKNTAQGRRVLGSDLGIVVHTRYKGKTLTDMQASFDVDQSKFNKDPSVNVISPELSDPGKFPAVSKSQYEKAIKDATEAYKSIKDPTFYHMADQNILIKTHINEHVRQGTSITVKSYIKFLQDRMKKEMNSVKTESAKLKKREKYEGLIETVNKYKDEFEKGFTLHSAVQKAKDALVQGLSNTPGEFRTTIGGKPTKPEGFVAIRGGKPTKLVDRSEFSAANFASGAFQKTKDDEDIGEIQPDDKPKNPIVFSFGRMNPPTAGHGVLVGKVKDLAKEQGAKHRIVLSRSQDPEKNPLSPEDKVKHAKRMFPDANIEAANESEPHIIAQMQRLEKEGHDHVTVVVGSDRVEEIQKLLDKYDGDKFKFKKISVVSAGNRDPDADQDDPTSISATRQRGHAINNKFREFQRGVPKGMHPDHARELFNSVRQGMDIKIDSTTPGISLARYAKRQDVIGVRARREIERRNMSKEMQKKIASSRNKAVRSSSVKSVKEEMTSSGGDVRGLGFVTGDPGGVLNTWTALNAADADTRDQIMNQVKKTMHDDIHAVLDKARADRISRIVSIIKDHK